MREILSTQEAHEGLLQIAREILARPTGASDLALVGIRRGGDTIAETIARHLLDTAKVQVPIGTVDITLYRDDAPMALPNPKIGRSDVPFDVSKRRILLVDDVLFTGRTVRAALHALLDYGRARSIELAVLIDRGGRELPIQADFVVKKLVVVPPEHVEVIVDGTEFRAVVT